MNNYNINVVGKLSSTKIFQKKYFMTIVLGLLFLLVFSCKDQPVVSTSQLKDQAQKAIELASSVDAVQYAPKEFNSAVSSFDQGEKAMSKDNTKSANSSYNDAIASAKEAYDKALPFFVKNLIEGTDDQIETSKDVLLQVSLFEKAVDLNKEAKAFYQDQDYLAAKEKTLEARDSIELAYKYADEIERNRNNLDKRVLQEGERIYTVKLNPDDRDCLWKIADREMGNPFAWKKIYYRNDDIIRNPNLIYPGQNLILPVK